MGAFVAAPVTVRFDRRSVSRSALIVGQSPDRLYGDFPLAARGALAWG